MAIQTKSAELRFKVLSRLALKCKADSLSPFQRTKSKVSDLPEERLIRLGVDSEA